MKAIRWICASVIAACWLSLATVAFVDGLLVGGFLLVAFGAAVSLVVAYEVDSATKERRRTEIRLHTENWDLKSKLRDCETRVGVLEIENIELRKRQER